MGHGLGLDDSDSDLSSAPPSPRLPPPPPSSSLSPPPHQSPSPPPSPPPQLSLERSHSSATEPPWKARPRPKRQPSTSVPNPPSSPKRRKQGETKDAGVGKGKETTGIGKVAAAGKGNSVGGGTKAKTKAKAVGKAKVQVPPKDPSPEPKASTSTDEKPSTKAASSAPWKKGGKAKVSPPPPAAPEIEPAPFSKAAPKPKPTPASSTITSRPPLNTSKSTPSDLPKPTLSTKPAPSSNKPTRTTKRPTYNESTDSSDGEEEEKPKRHKRRRSHFEATPKSGKKPRPSLPAQPTPKAKSKAKSELDSGLVELRPASFLTKTSSLSFMNKPTAPSTSLALQPREDVWSYDDLTGLTWVKLDIHKCEIVPGNEQNAVLGEQWCWWPAEVKQNTTNGIKLVLCGLGIERELGPCVAAETNILTFRKPNSSSARFPTFKTAFSPLTGQVGSSPAQGEPSTGEASDQPAGEPATPPTELSTILPTSPSALESTWKQALARAFEIDTESNDGLVDIHLLFSQKSTISREEDQSSGNMALDEESDDDQDDVLESGTTVLCRYRTRYYPAKIISYHPLEGKARRRAKGKYKCAFADDSTKLAIRREILTTLDDGFVTCSLGTYQQYRSHGYAKPTSIREPSPSPRANSPAPEPEECMIDPEEYCSRERMRDQLRPVLPFLKGLIERRYIPGRGAVERSGDGDGSPVKQSGDSDDPTTKDSNDQATKEQPSGQAITESTSSLEAVLDRHAVFMQGGRARKNLAYSVYTGDLNEDDCEELMFEISRWALRGERWACEEGTSQGGEATNQEGGGATSPEGTEGEASGVTQEGGVPGRQVEVGESTSQPAHMVVEPNTEDGVAPKEPENEGTVEAQASDRDVDMQDATQETNAGQTSEPQTDAKSGDTTELEDEPPTVVKLLENAPSVPGDFRSLLKLQPPRPTGAPDYEGLTPEERMGYVSDVLYPEAAALILSYRRGIRTQPGPLADPTAEHALYIAGLQAAKNTCSTSDWVEQILAIRQLRQSNSKYQVEEQAQVVAGGTRSRPKYMASVLK